MNESSTRMDIRTDAVSPRPRTSDGKARRLVFLLGVLVVALAPALLNALGIAGDYPNHLARVYIEQELARSPSLQKHFTLEWGIYPDLAMDMLVGPLMSVLGPYKAGAAFNVVALAMLPLGVMLLAKATTGQVEILPAGSVLLIYGLPATWGFMNYVFAMGVATLLFAAWVYMRSGWPRTCFFVPSALFLFFSHVLGFLLLCFLILAYEVGRYTAGRRGSLRQFGTSLLLQGLIVTALPTILFAISFRARAAGLETDLTEFGDLVTRAQAFVAPFDYHGGPETLVLFAGFYGGLFIAFRRGWMTLQPAMKPVLLAATGLVLAMPNALLGISLLDIRYGVIPAAVILGGSSLTGAGQSHRKRLLLGFVLLLALQQTTVHVEMAALDWRQQQIRAALQQIPDGGRVLIGASTPPDELHALADTPGRMVQSLMHTPALAVIEVDGYVPNLFTNTSPVGISSTAAPIHLPQAQPLSAAELLEGQRNPPPQQVSGSSQYGYFLGWPITFEFLLWLTPDNVPAPETKHLSETVQGDGFRLYAIVGEGVEREIAGPGRMTDGSVGR